MLRCEAAIRLQLFAAALHFCNLKILYDMARLTQLTLKASDLEPFSIEDLTQDSEGFELLAPEQINTQMLRTKCGKSTEFASSSHLRTDERF